MQGLYIVTTPIGNIDDISIRAKKSFETTEYIYAEDTRVVKSLLKDLGIDYSQKKIMSFHDHSNENEVAKIIDKAKEHMVVFCSDAGSPLISDPALPLIRAAINNEVQLCSLGGVCAPIIALELSGLPATPFHFHGFLPRDNGPCKRELEKMGEAYGTHIFFEGVARVEKTLKLLCELYPTKEIVVARELTKTYESLYRFKGEDLNKVLPEMVMKGEFVVLFYQDSAAQKHGHSELEKLAYSIIEKGARPKEISKLLAQITGEKSKDIYMKLNRDSK